MSMFQVTTATLKSKATELKSLNSKFKTEVSNLKTTEGSLNGMWDGEAHDAFHKAFNSDVTQMDKFATEIEKYIQALEKIADEYDKAEKANVSTANTRSYK